MTLDLSDPAFLALFNIGICTTEVYSETTDDSNFNLGANGNNAGVRYGVEINSGNSGIGKYIEKLRFYVGRVGSPTGNCFAKVYDSSNVEQATSNAVDVTTIIASPGRQNLDMDLTTVHQLAVDDRIVLEYTNGSATNYIAVNARNLAIQANFTHIYYDGTVWSDPNPAWRPRHTWDRDPTCP